MIVNQNIHEGTLDFHREIDATTKSITHQNQIINKEIINKKVKQLTEFYPPKSNNNNLNATDNSKVKFYFNFYQRKKKKLKVNKIAGSNIKYSFHYPFSDFKSFKEKQISIKTLKNAVNTYCTQVFQIIDAESN